MFTEAGTAVSAVSSVSSVVLRVLRADRRRGLAILDRARGRARRGRDYSAQVCQMTIIHSEYISMALKTFYRVRLTFLSTHVRHKVYLSLKSATPGKTLARVVHRRFLDKWKMLTFPSNNSRLAPPPVLTWLSLLSAPYCATTVAVSPPPTITTAPFWAASMLASRRSLDPPAKAGNSNTPGGLDSYQ